MRRWRSILGGGNAKPPQKNSGSSPSSSSGNPDNLGESSLTEASLLMKTVEAIQYAARSDLMTLHPGFAAEFLQRFSEICKDEAIKKQACLAKQYIDTHIQNGELLGVLSEKTKYFLELDRGWDNAVIVRHGNNEQVLRSAIHTMMDELLDMRMQYWLGVRKLHELAKELDKP